MSSGPEFDRLWPSAQPTPFRGSVKPRCYLFPSKIRNANLAHQRLAVALADDFLDEPDKRTPQFGVADLRERSDQFQSVGVGEKVGDVRGRRSRCALPDVARDLGSAFEEEQHRYLQNVGHCTDLFGTRQRWRLRARLHTASPGDGGSRSPDLPEVALAESVC